jgi:hypothetical protein
MTMPTYNIDDRIIRIIDSLTKAVNVCYAVDLNSGDYEKDYPYACGYAKSTMDCAIDDLNRIVKELRK